MRTGWFNYGLRVRSPHTAVELLLAFLFSFLFRLFSFTLLSVSFFFS
jgi:hypothetical protein